MNSVERQLMQDIIQKLRNDRAIWALCAILNVLANVGWVAWWATR